VIHQLEKFTEVISAKELDTEHSYWREAAIIKLEIESGALDRLKSEYNFEILDHKNQDTCIIQIAGATHRIDAFIAQLGEEHIVEISRTGVAALEK
jgi:acetolactate synthase-1/3 small subunit